MHHADIKALLAKAGFTQRSLAKTLPQAAGEFVSRAAVSRVINGKLKSARIAQRISAVVCKPVAELWPGKYPELEFLQRLPAKQRVTLEKSAAALVAKPVAPKKPAAKKRAGALADQSTPAPEINLIDPKPPGILGVQRDAAAPRSERRPTTKRGQAATTNRERIS